MSREETTDNGIHFTTSSHNIPTPRRSTVGSVGFDFFSPVDITIKSNEHITINTGVRVAIPIGVGLFIYIRSSLGKQGIILANQVGVIDADYKEEIKVILHNTSKLPYRIKKHDRIVQGVFMKCLLGEPVKGKRSGGIGSTGV